MEMKQGTLWKVKKMFIANKDKQRRMVVEEGEIIEIRYPYKWHFRTQHDNIYLQQTEEILLESCEPLGTIWENVRFANIATLKTIIDNRLYTPHEEKNKLQE